MSILKFFSSNKKRLEELVCSTFKDPPCLETPRLLLCKIVPSHAEDMYEYSCDPEVTKYLTWSPHSSLAETERFVKLLQKKYDNGTFNDWGLMEKSTGKFIGTCGYTSFNYEENTAEVGYVLSKDYWGKGLAAEAVRAVMKFGFERFGLEGFLAKHMEGNDASGKVMQKCGMKFKGLYKHSMFIKGEFKNIVVYTITKTEFFEKLNEAAV